MTRQNEWLNPMKEAPSVEGLLLFQRHPHLEGTGGGVLVTVGAWLAGPKAVVTLRRVTTKLGKEKPRFLESGLFLFGVLVCCIFRIRKQGWDQR
jgi:hypothetical protein